MSNTTHETRITPEMIRSWCPCFRWTDERIIEAFGGREYVTVTDILRATSDDIISISNAFFWVLREEVIDARTLRIFACDCAERALNRERAAGREPGPENWNVLAVSRRFADGEETNESLFCSWCAIWLKFDMSWPVVSQTANLAAGSTAMMSARVAALGATDSAANNAEFSENDVEARNAARDAERQWQLNHLIELIEKAQESDE